MPFSKLLASVMFYAENGFPLPERGARAWINKNLLIKPGYQTTYIPGGVRPGLGDLFKNPDLGSSLRQVAAKGRDGYYNGELTERMVKFLQAQGGAYTLEDFADYLIPALMEKDGMQIGFGIMGGWNQSQAHAQFVANVVGFGMNVQAALESAHFTRGTFEGCDVSMESHTTIPVREALTGRGHIIKVVDPFRQPWDKARPSCAIPSAG